MAGSLVLVAKRDFQLEEIAYPYLMGEEILAKFKLWPSNFKEARRFIEEYKAEGYDIEATVED